jgi:hypothetical protein
MVPPNAPWYDLQTFWRYQGRSVTVYFPVLPGSIQALQPRADLLGRDIAAVALELVNQANETGLRVDRIVHATGSAGTQAGLLAGLAMINARIPVLGINVSDMMKLDHTAGPVRSVSDQERPT